MTEHLFDKWISQAVYHSMQIDDQGYDVIITYIDGSEKRLHGTNDILKEIDHQLKIQMYFVFGYEIPEHMVADNR